jgi:hypothetical protein
MANGSGPKNSWEGFTLNLAGITLFEDDFPVVAEGDYQVEITETDNWWKKGTDKAGPPSSVIFRCKIVEECSEKGKPVAIWIGKGDNDGNRRNWKAAYASIGIALEKLETSINIHPSHFTGKKAFVSLRYNAPIAEGGKPKSDEVDTKFISPASYAERKSNRGGVAVISTPGFKVGGAAPGLPGTGASAAPLAAPQPPGGSGLFGAIPGPVGAPNSAGAPPPLPS